MAEVLDIKYVHENDPEFDHTRHVLDLFFPPEENRNSNFPILIFIHGGTWIYGNKDPYALLGRNMAHYGIMTANINYRLGNSVNFHKMALDCARAVKWVTENAYLYGGNSEKITISGHSAGGHLGALIGLNSDYFGKIGIDNSISKVLLIDAFGLNIGHMIKKHGDEFLSHIEKIFSKDPEIWKSASPLNFINSRKIPFYILVGGRSYPMVLADNKYFTEKLKKVNEEVTFYEVPGKSHLEMISQFQKKDNLLYKQITNFIKS